MFFLGVSSVSKVGSSVGGRVVGRVGAERVIRRLLVGDSGCSSMGAGMFEARDFRGFVVALLPSRLDGVLTTESLDGGLAFRGDASVEVMLARVDFRRLLGGGDSTVVNISSASSTSTPRVIRRLFLFLLVEIASTPEFLTEPVVVAVGSDFTDFTGDDAFDEGNDPPSPTKNGHVGVLLLCSFLHR